jgi:hypothetical protein
MSAVSAPVPTTYAISGTVYKGTSSAPAGAGEVTVSVWQGSTSLGSVPTDAEGNYSFPGLSDGQYFVLYTYNGAGGFATEWWPNSAPAVTNAQQPITIADGDHPNTNIALMPPETISGTVSLGYGSTSVAAPAAGVVVSYQVRTSTGWSSVLGSVTTDSNGAYQTPQVPVGMYLLHLHYAGSGDFQDIYFSHSASINGAQTVYVEGTGVQLANAALPEPQSFGGTVALTPSGAPVSTGDVTLTANYYDADQGKWLPVGSTTTDASGRYEFANLPESGKYQVSAIYNGTAAYFPISNKYVPSALGAPIPDVNLTLARSYSLTGHIDLGTDGNSAGAGEVQVRVVASTSGQTISTASTQANGDFTASGLPAGSYQVYLHYTGTGDYPDLLVPSDGSCASTCTFTASNSDVTLSTIMPLGNAISGVVTGTDGRALAGIIVDVTRVDSTTHVGVQYFGTTTAADGSYSMKDLPVGLYELQFGDNSGDYIGQTYNDEPLYNGQPDLVSLGPGTYLTNISPVLQRTGSISGTITVVGGYPVVSLNGLVEVELEPYDPTTHEYIYSHSWDPSATFGPDGTITYDLIGLPPGNYKIRFVSNAQGRAGASTSPVITVVAGVTVNYNATISTVVVPPPAFGVIDTAVVSPGQVTLTGWALAPGWGAPVYMLVIVDGVFQAQSAVADGYKAGLSSAFPGETDEHGYTVTLTTLTSGTHTVCVAPDYSWSYPGTTLCRTLTVLAGAPIGVIDSATAGRGSISLTGWMFDPDVTAADQVGVTVDAVAQPNVTANGVKPGLAAAFPAYGDNHDYSVTLTGLSGGAHTVCVQGINVGPGANSAPLCRVVVVPTGSPFGVVDTATAAPSTLVLTGWMLDPDTASAVDVDVSLDGLAKAPVVANGVKSGLGAAFPGYGDNHDYSVTLTGVVGGSHTVCLVGVNLGAGTNSAPLCRTLVVPTGSPFGVIDTTSATPGSINVAGWMLDPDTASAISVSVSLDGVTQPPVLANGVKSGLGAAFPGYGDNHDYTVSIVGSFALGSHHQICVAGINVAGGTDSSPLCRTVTITAG